MLLLDHPVRESIVVYIKSQSFVLTQVVELLPDVEVVNNLASRLNPVIDELRELFDMSQDEVALEGLAHELLEEDLSVLGPESSHFFHLGIPVEQLVVVTLSIELGIFPHQVLGQEDAWVETLFDRFVDGSLIIFHDSFHLF